MPVTSTSKTTRAGACPRHPLYRRCRSVLDGDAGDVGTLQGPAYRLGLIAIEAGEARPEQLFIAFGDHRFGERIGLGEQSAGLAARGFDALLRFGFAVQCADLNDPAGMGRDGFDGTVLLDGLWLGARRRIRIGQSLRGGSGLRGGGGLLPARRRQPAAESASTAAGCRLSREFGPCPLGTGPSVF